MNENKEQLIFVLTCIKSDYPQHLIPGVRYKVDANDKNSDNELCTYWFHPMDNKWVCIGYFALSCFDTTPIKEYLNRKKGIATAPSAQPAAPVRQRPVVPELVIRTRPEPVVRSRPVSNDTIIRRRS